jgi:hypothetical protein
MTDSKYKEYSSITRKSFWVGREARYIIKEIGGDLCLCLYADGRVLVSTPLNDAPFFMKQIKVLEKVILLTIPKRKMLLELERYEEIIEMEKKELKEIRNNNNPKEKTEITRDRLNDCPMMSFECLKNNIKRLMNNEPVDKSRVESEIKAIDSFLRDAITVVDLN